MSKKPSKIAILHGGGPAPGSAGVFEGVVVEAQKQGIEVWGIPFGFSGLRKGDLSLAEKLTPEKVKDASKVGGTFLPTHRASMHGKESYPQNALKALKEKGIDALVVIGGEDSGSSAYVISKTAKDSGVSLSVVHAAKTIDGDIYHPQNLLTFGVDTAAKQAAQDLIACKMELVSNPDRCFLVGIMGRASGELARLAAVEAGKHNARPDLVLVPELFPDLVPMEVVRNAISAAIIKRRSRGLSGGVILCSEGVLERCSEESIIHLISGAPVDEHGHIQHSRIQFAYHMGRLLEEFHQRIGLRDSDGKPLAVTSLEIGYGRLRCGPPSEFDREYTLCVGTEAVKLLAAGESGLTLFYRGDGKVDLRPFAESVNAESKRMRTRQMDLKVYKELIVKDSPFLTRADLNDPAIYGQTELSAYAFSVRFANAVYAMEHVTEAR